MKPRLILLFTPDRTFDQLVREAFLGTSAIVFIARNVADALQIVCQRGRVLDFALLDFDGRCRGMTLLSAVHSWDFEGRGACNSAPQRQFARRNLDQGGISQKGGRQPESVEVLPI